MFFHMLSSLTLAPVGQFLIQAQQRMHSSILVATLPLIEMAAVGHTLAHVPQTVHVSSLVTGETAIDRAPLLHMEICREFPNPFGHQVIATLRLYL